MRNDLHFYTYIPASSSGKQGEIAGFTKRYAVDRLVYFENFDDIRTAIDREKQLKGWVRAKKVWLIERENAGWLNLSREWFDSRGPSTPPLRGSAQDDK